MRELGEQGGLGGKVEGAVLQHLRSACSVLVLCCGSSRLGCVLSGITWWAGCLCLSRGSCALSYLSRRPGLTLTIGQQRIAMAALTRRQELA